MSKKRNILITGANGLLGKQVVRDLHKTEDIYALVRNIPENKLDNVTYLSIDLSSNWSTEDLPDDISDVLHFAQSEKFRDFPNEAMDVFSVNVNSTSKLLDYAQKNKVQNFIYASSGGVYGGGSEAFKENSPLVPYERLGYYLGSKLCSEILVQNYAALMSVIVLRFFFIYGKEQKRNMLMPRLVDNVRDGNPITLQGEKGLSINPIHVEDASTAVCNALNLNKSATYNIAGSNTYSLKDIGLIIGELVGKDPIFEYKDEAHKDLIANNETMVKDLHAPTINLENGIKDIL